METTTFRIPEELLRRTRIASAVHRIPQQTLVKEGLEIRLAQLDKKAKLPR